MNSPLVIRTAKSIADSVLAQQKQDKSRLEEIYVRILDRPPDPKEIDLGLTYVQSLRQRWSEIDEGKAWQSLCHALMASNEFIFVY